MNTQHDAWDKVASEVNFTLSPDWKWIDQYIAKSDRILDLGCGYGRVTKELYDKGFTNVAGYDTSLKLLTRGKTESPFLDLNLYSTPKLLEETASFDAVICFAVMTCIPDKKDRAITIQELARVLKPNGIIYLAEFLRSSDKEYTPRESSAQNRE